MATKRSVLAVGGAALLVLASCSDDIGDESDATTPVVVVTMPATSGTDTPATEAPVESTITVEGAWARTSPSGVDKGAAYMVITSAVDDRLLSVAVSDEVAMDAQIHETVMGGSMTTDSMPMSSDTAMSNDTMAGDTMAPSMMMQEVDAIDLPAGEAVALEPGGYHIMLMGLAAPLELGQQFVLTLTFEQAGDVEVTATVADEPPMS